MYKKTSLATELHWQTLFCHIAEQCIPFAIWIDTIITWKYTNSLRPIDRPTK